jgi:hypothetical protein
MEVTGLGWQCTSELLQRGGGGFTCPIWAWPGQWGLVCRCCYIRATIVKAVEVVSSHTVATWPSLTGWPVLSLVLLPLGLMSFHIKKAMVASKPWWRMLEGGIDGWQSSNPSG